MLSFLFNQKDKFDPLLEIFRAVRLMSKKQLSGAIAIEDKERLGKYLRAKNISKDLLAENIVKEVQKTSPKGLVVDLDNIKKVNVDFPYPVKNFQPDLTDLELGALGLSQLTDAIILIVNRDGSISLANRSFVQKN